MNFAEKRSQPRRKAAGGVEVRFTNGHVRQIHGELMDVSDSGFRMAHGCPDLTSGQMVEFQHSEASGTARVMWNRIVAEKVETGFFVLA